MLIDLESIEAQHIHPILTQTVIPRPVAWVLSQNPGDDYNWRRIRSLPWSPVSRQS